MNEIWDNNHLIPIYDSEDAVCGIIYNNTPYYFNKNLQGDIIAICNSNGETVARYSYDAWGVCTIVSDTTDCNIATVNPFRYRGYYYDQETNLYYLQSRYYDALVGRFINADEPLIVNLQSNSLYQYGNNSPLNYMDETGFWAEKLYNFTLIEKGFKCKTNMAFLSSTYCYKYAANIYSIYKKKRSAIKKMGVLRMAVELYSHALAYYFGKILVHFWRERGLSYMNHGVEAYVNQDDKWAYKYWIVWGFSRVVKYFIIGLLLNSRVGIIVPLSVVMAM